MQFEIPFDEKLFKEQTIKNFELLWAKNLKGNNRRLFWGIPAILIGGLLTYNQDKFGFLFIAIGAHYLINFYEFFNFHKKTKKGYLETINTEIIGQQKANEKCIWEFNEEYFRYKDYKTDTRLKWIGFDKIRVIEKNLFLDLDAGGRLSFILSEDEIGMDNFKKVTEFVKLKLDKKPAHNKT